MEEKQCPYTSQHFFGKSNNTNFGQNYANIDKNKSFEGCSKIFTHSVKPL